MRWRRFIPGDLGIAGGWWCACVVLVVLEIATLAGCFARPKFPGFAHGPGGLVPSGLVGPPSSAMNLSPEVARLMYGDALTPNQWDEYAKAWADGKKQGKKESGREKARAMIHWTGYLAFVASGIAVVVTILIVFVGGTAAIARGQAIRGFVTAGLCLVTGYFLLVYGVIVSEIVCWIIMAGITAAVCFTVYSYIRAWIDTRKAKSVIAVRPDAGLALLPVREKDRADIGWAIETVKSAAGAVNGNVLEAKYLLNKFKLPMPVRAEASGEGREARA
jgi:hypothetical protein